MGRKPDRSPGRAAFERKFMPKFTSPYLYARPRIGLTTPVQDTIGPATEGRDISRDPDFAESQKKALVNDLLDNAIIAGLDLKKVSPYVYDALQKQSKDVGKTSIFNRKPEDITDLGRYFNALGDSLNSNRLMDLVKRNTQNVNLNEFQTKFLGMKEPAKVFRYPDIAMGERSLLENKLAEIAANKKVNNINVSGFYYPPEHSIVLFPSKGIRGAKNVPATLAHELEHASDYTRQPGFKAGDFGERDHFISPWNNFNADMSIMSLIEEAGKNGEKIHPQLLEYYNSLKKSGTPWVK